MGGGKGRQGRGRSEPGRGGVGSAVTSREEASGETLLETGRGDAVALALQLLSRTGPRRSLGRGPGANRRHPPFYCNTFTSPPRSYAPGAEEGNPNHTDTNRDPFQFDLRYPFRTFSEDKIVPLLS